MLIANVSRFRLGVKKWLDRSLSPFECVLGWLVATIVFVGLTGFIGGPVQGDSAISIFTTWLIAHGHIACSYSSFDVARLPSLAQPFSFIAPLYPLLTAGFLALFHITYSVPFPSAARLGNHCLTSNFATYKWAVKAGAITPTVDLGYLTWFPLMAGTVALLRAVGRGRKGWEPATLLFLAVLPPVFDCLTEYFHPQDILALGFVLGSLACGLRGRWIRTGILIGLAFTSNQYGILIAAPMLVLAPRSLRIKFVTAALATVALIVVPMVILTSGHALRSSLLGSGFSGGRYGAVLWETGLRGTSLLVVSRASPIIVAMALAWWAKHRLGDDVLQPIPFLSIAATSLALRLVFETGLWGYYFLAVTTLLVLIDVIYGRFRSHFLAWLTLLIVTIDPFPWGFMSNGQSWGLAAREWLPNIVAASLAFIVTYDLRRHRIRWYVVALLIFVCATLVKWPWNHEALRQQLPVWLTQVVLVPIALWLSLSPLLGAVRNRSMVEKEFVEA
jgi:hypothetical protein